MNSKVYTGYFDGLIDDVRFYNTAIGTSTMNTHNQELQGNESNLVAYYKLNNGYSDYTANGYNLGGDNSPTFTSTVPFSTGTGSTGQGDSTTYYYTYSGATTTISKQYIGEDYSPTSQLSYLNARYYDPARGQFLSQDPVFWEVGQTRDGKTALLNPQSQNSYSYAENNPIVKKDSTGRQYADFNGSFTARVYGIPIGLTGGFYLVSGSSDPLVYFGGTVTSKPGPSGSVMYSPTGKPSEGWSGSMSLFPKSAQGLGGQGSFGKDRDGKFGPSGEFGIGTQGIAGSITYTISLNKLLSALGGPFENISTPMTTKQTLLNNYNNQQNFGGSMIQSRVSVVNAYNASTGASTPQSKLWVTPSGAVVNWGGQLVSGPVKSR